MRAIAGGLLAVALPLAAQAQSATAPVRTLVYTFESRELTGTDVHAGPGTHPPGEINGDDAGDGGCGSGGARMANRVSAGVSAGNGGADWFQVDCGAGYGYQVAATGPSERGSIQVLVLRQQVDRGLVVQLSERSAQRSSAPATCVVYPTTSFICDPNAEVFQEEVTLLRFLAPDFVNTPRQDGSRWQVGDQGTQASFRATYTILQDAAGVMTIAEQRTAIGTAGPNSSAESSSRILYDAARAVPTAIEEQVEHKDVRFGQYRTGRRDTVFRLQPPNIATRC